METKLFLSETDYSTDYSTTDTILTLYGKTELLRARKKKMFCAFIDFSKAFDSV